MQSTRAIYRRLVKDRPETTEESTLPRRQITLRLLRALHRLIHGSHELRNLLKGVKRTGLDQ